MKPLIVANWKMNPPTIQEAKILFKTGGRRASLLSQFLKFKTGGRRASLLSQFLKSI